MQRWRGAVARVFPRKASSGDAGTEGARTERAPLPALARAAVNPLLPGDRPDAAKEKQSRQEVCEHAQRPRAGTESLAKTAQFKCNGEGQYKSRGKQELGASQALPQPWYLQRHHFRVSCPSLVGTALAGPLQGTLLYTCAGSRPTTVFPLVQPRSSSTAIGVSQPAHKRNTCSRASPICIVPWFVLCGRPDCPAAHLLVPSPPLPTAPPTRPCQQCSDQHHDGHQEG